MAAATQAGVAVLAVKDGVTVHQRAKGLASLASAPGLDENTVFEVASVTKPIAAVAIARLYE